MAKEKKDPFEALDKEFKDAVESESLEQLAKRFSDVAKSEEANQAAKKADEDLLRAQEQVANAQLGYTEVTKANKLKKKYIIRYLADKGDSVAQGIIQNILLAESMKG